MIFDRGTLVLKNPPAGLDLKDIPGVAWDPRTGECRAPGYQYGALIAQLHERGVELDDQVRASRARPVMTRQPELRPYQDSALCAWQIAGCRGVVALPTGSGKTRLALCAIAACRASALVLVPTRVLLAQWSAEIEAVLDLPVGLYGDGERQLAPVTVSTFESAYRHMPRIGQRFALLIVDEAHHFGSGMREEALMMCTAPSRLGLTATPPREAPATDKLRELIGPVVYQLAIADLTGDYLADYELTTLTLPLNASERAAYELDMARFRPLCRQFFRVNPLASWRDFVRTARRTPDGREALEAWRRSRRLLSFIESKRQALAWLLERHCDARVLVFTSDNDTAYAIARAHLIMPITCDIGRVERAAALERFRAGALRALVSARVLNEGLDVPDADVAVIVGGNASEREHVQRVGRLLRPAPGKRALVYELVAADTSEVGQSERRRRGLSPSQAASMA
jgi:superfamily II DNA or RNA helicase